MSRTPIQRLGDVNSNTIWMKREDLIPFSFGGNKARKAELFFAAFDKGNYDCVVTYGTGSSNHCRVIANECCRRKIECYIISPEGSKNDTFNSQMIRFFGAKVIKTQLDNVHDTISTCIFDLNNKGKHPFFIEGGGHGDIGTEAYVRCFQEIQEQENSLGVHFDYIFLASGTGTTQAGLVCGKIIANANCQIIGISIARKNPRGRDIIIDSINSYLNNHNYNIDDKIIQNATIFLDNYTKEYGVYNDDIVKTIQYALINYGIPLDSTYTGKAFAGMMDYMENLSNKNILFIHTGGTPLFFDTLREIK